MNNPIKLNLKVYQGSTFRETLRWESSTKAYKPVTGITKAAPTVITSVAHGLPLGWRFRVTNVLGMKEINCSTEQYYYATDTSADAITINSLNSLAYSDYLSGGVVEYNIPVPLAGYTGRMQIRPNLASDEVILELTSLNGRIIVDEINSTITINIAATDTATLNFASAVYSLELINGDVVTPFLTGSVSLAKEVTR